MPRYIKDKAEADSISGKIKLISKGIYAKIFSVYNIYNGGRKKL